MAGQSTSSPGAPRGPRRCTRPAQFRDPLETSQAHAAALGQKLIDIEMSLAIMTANGLTARPT